jgi:hypothetical protein
MIPAVDDHRSRVGQNPTGASLTTLVSGAIPLNRKQQMIVEKILCEFLTWATTLTIRRNANRPLFMLETLAAVLM